MTEMQLMFLRLESLLVSFLSPSGGRSQLPGAPEIKVGDGATQEQIIDALRRAGDIAVESGQPVYVRF
jgi:hypothetical protein